ncbi:hypothetical protein MKX67_05465 [Cytobacillus sp. FSL W7-1323]|uniref:Uncharacterized protein n=1 Tax=Cytobacillus kochii TaxID=859143 RepID=A0A248TES8_9BACI|nr:hypothetical protein [Cytobacillus kochii]ASV66711.1 hypothetical protein CKF48_04890 [Cytobacillus kochii]MCA1024750.1 hypothetical protein [Cytobacillus kochii]MCM3323767.1 hypothetical protein [Cytobacillus kochii]MCM3346052.1 hypothetical protein [Cytobacillus kochii]MDM5206443.1 hypothetical protein [Cytobacillus kochii]
MFGTVPYYVNIMKSTIMMNSYSAESYSLRKVLDQYKEDIRTLSVEEEKIQIYLRNAERAYSIVRHDVIGWEENDCEHGGEVYTRVRGNHSF